MPRVLALVVALAAGCADDPPTIRTLKYTPNAANVGLMSSINGTVDYTDSDGDISQSQVMLAPPAPESAITSPKVPIMNVNQGAIGTVDFTLNFTPDLTGNYTFDVWIIDLKGRESNRLGGVIQVAAAN